MKSKNNKIGSKSGKAKEEIIQVNMRHVKLTPASKRKCRKVKEPLWGDVAWAIEGGDWWLPVKNYKYTHLKSEFEKGMRDFFHLDFDVEISDFDTGIIEYDNHR